MKQGKRFPSQGKPSRGTGKTASRPAREQPVVLSVQNPNAAGIDVHCDMHMVCVPADRDPEPVRRFDANTCDLHAIADWLKQCGVTTIAMESTGVYWIALFELLETRGTAHARAFLMRARVGETAFPSAWGRTRKEAERWAAHEALLVLNAH